eukprot:TRINITY_DN16107_c0_g1_i6.p1 TRINITY_DN16107_c0_g1~~TRINITY_DN16107_c0_g1_i6.p1  ORF type:complete len:838 (-),score=235.25 TRINITY_DN16107_c0_g1_i6:424-2937(-)
MQPCQEPFLLLQADTAHSRLSLAPGALERLSAIPGELSVLSVVGPQRGGKSTLLNLLQHRSPGGGFGVGHTMAPHTMGVWARVRQHPRNPAVSMLLLDTEGLDAPHVHQSYNWALSAVALLVSNVFVYQSVVSIDKAAIERLQLILNLGSRVLEPSGSGVETRRSFVWLVRDHQLALTQQSPTDEMLNKLGSEAVHELQACFSSQECALLCCPMHKEAELAGLDQKQFSQLSPEFREDFTVLERRLFDLSLHPAFLGGQKLTGDGLGQVLQLYMAALFDQQHGMLQHMQQMPTQAQVLAQVAAQRASAAALQCYTQMNKCGEQPLSQADLMKLHSKSKLEAMTLFDSMAYQEHACTEAEKALLAVAIEQWSEAPMWSSERSCFEMSSTLAAGVLHRAWEENAQASQTCCAAEWESVAAQTEQSVRAGEFGSLEEFQLRVSEVVRRFNASEVAVGVQKASVCQAGRHRLCEMETTVLAELLKRQAVESKSQTDEILELASSQLSAQQRTISEQKAEIEASSSQIRELGRSLEALSEQVTRNNVAVLDKFSDVARHMDQAKIDSEDKNRTLVTKVSSLFTQRINEAIVAEQSSRETAEAELGTRLGEECERMRHALADGIAGIPYAISKADDAIARAVVLVEQERAEREEALQRSTSRLEDECSRLEDALKQGVGECEVGMAQIRAQIENVDEIRAVEQRLASTFEEECMSLTSRLDEVLEQCTQGAAETTAANEREREKLTATLGKSLDDKIAATGRKFQGAMGKWCKEAISKGDTRADKDRASREQAEAELNTKLEVWCARLEKALDEGLAGIPCELTCCWRVDGGRCNVEDRSADG